MNLIGIKTFFDSQINKSEHNIDVDNRELNHIVPMVTDMLKKGFSNHACDQKEKEVLKEIYKDIKLITKESKNHSLLDLKKKIKIIIKTGYFTENFSSVKEGSFEDFKFWVSSQVSSIKKKLSDRISSSFYIGHTNKKQYLNNKNELLGLGQKIKDTHSRYQEKIIQLSRETDNSKIPNLKAELSHLLEKLDALSKKKEPFQKNVSLFEKDEIQGLKTKKLFVNLGGERVDLKTKDDIHLDAMYLSADEFRNKLSDARAQQFSIDRSRVPTESFPFDTGIIFDTSNTKAKELLNTLNELGLLQSGYLLKKIGHNKMALVENPHNLRVSAFTIPEKALKLDSLTLPPKENTGTIMLGLGNVGIFELQKRAPLAFLMTGMNVMMFNFRGYGKSEGEPTPEGTYEDVETVYQYLKEKKKVEDKQIIAKGLCLSGGIMSHLAEKHPDINLFLDQTYAEFSNIALEVANEEVNKFVSKFQVQKKTIEENKKESYAFHFIKALITPVIKLLLPEYSTLKGIEKVNGKTLILTAKEDKLIPKNELDKMLKHASEKGTLKNITVATIPGQHAVNFLDAKETIEDTTYSVGKSSVNHFLSSLNFYNPIIPQKKAIKEDLVSAAKKEDVINLKKAFKESSVDKVSKGWEEIEL